MAKPSPAKPALVKKPAAATPPAAAPAWSDAGLYQVLSERGELLPGRSVALERATLRKMYETLVLIRVLDDRMIKWQRQGKISFYGAAFGEEGAVVGSAVPLQQQDWLFPALRQGGAALYRGYKLEHYIANVLANDADLLKGRQMPCHYADRSINHVSWSSCIGPQVPQAVGAAWAFKILKQPRVAVGYLGDGASSEGDFHVAMNFAGVFRVPCVLFLNNNQWAISVPNEKQTAGETFAVKARAYGFEGIRVDGNDPLAVAEVMKFAVEKARAGGGPTLIEALTYRLGAHSTSDDPSRYRDEREAERWKKEKDPLTRLENYLRASGRLAADEPEQFAQAADRKVRAAIAAVEHRPAPGRATMTQDVFAKPTPRLKKQQAEIDRLPEFPPAH